MSWRCDTCGGTRAIYDTSWSEPILLGCFRCDSHVSTACGRPTVAYMPRTIRLLDDLAAVWPADEANVWNSTLVERLAALRPDVYGEWTDGDDADRTGRLTAAVKPYGITSKPVGRRRNGEQITRRGIARAALDRAKNERKSSFVYFVEREGLIKIGTTTNLRSRLKTLGKGGSMPPGMTVGPVKLLASTRGTRVEEREYHEKFRKQRIPKTEWFRPNKALWREIETIQRTGSDIFAELASA